MMVLESRGYLEEAFGGTHINSCVGSQMCNRGFFLLFPRVTQALMVLREKLVLQV